MNTRHDNPDGPEDIDKAFAEIVSGLENDPQLPRWPQDRTADSSPEQSPTRSGTEAESAEASGDQDLGGPRDFSPAPEEEGHYEPPEPPPLPAPKAGTVGGVTLILLGLVLLFMPRLAGWLGTLALPAGLVTISAGIGWLLLRMRHSPADSGWDDGAQL